jgi:phage/plasmid-associated DNA primase
MDDIGRFIEEHCDVEPGVWSASGALYERYHDWAMSNGELPLLTQKALATRLKKKGFEVKKSSGKRGWCGLRLKRSWVRAIEASSASILPALPSGTKS